VNKPVKSVLTRDSPCEQTCKKCVLVQIRVSLIDTW